MKKFAVSGLIVLLIMAMFCAQGFAVYGDVTVTGADAYIDPEMTQYLGTIPKYTALVVWDADSSVAAVLVNGVNCFVRASTLTNSRFDYLYKGYSVLRAGVTVYQQPAFHSRSICNGHNRTVLVIGVKGDWVLIRSGFGGYFGFAQRSDMIGFTPVS